MNSLFSFGNYYLCQMNILPTDDLSILESIIESSTSASEHSRRLERFSKIKIIFFFSLITVNCSVIIDH